MFAAPWLTQTPPRYRYVMSAAAVAVCALIRLALDPWLGGHTPFVVFLFGIMFSACVGGLGPGLFATALSLLASQYLFVEPRHVLLAIDSWHRPLSFLLYGLVGVFISILCQIHRASHGRFRTLAEGMPHMVWETDAQGMNYYQNQVWYEYVGAGPGSSYGQDWLNYYHPDDRQHLLEEWTAALHSAGAHTYEVEARIRRHDGVYRWFRIKGVPIRNRAGAVVKWVGTCTDIDELRQVEQDLRRSRRMLRNILDTVPVRVFWKDRNSIFLGCNQAFAQDAGFQSPDQLIGKSDAGMGWHDEAELYRADDRLVMDTGQPKLGYEEPQTTPDGRRIWLRTSKTPLRDLDGRIIGVLGTYEDITQHKAAEGALRQSESLYRAIARSMPESLVSVVDRDMRYCVVDGPLLASFGHKPEMLEGHRPDEVLDDDLARLIIRRMRRALAGEITEYETERNGRVYWSEYLPLRDSRGEVFAAMSLMLDITQRKRVEKVTTQQAAELNTLYATAPVGLFFFDTDLRFVRVNHMMGELNGLPAEQHIGRTLRELLTAELADAVEPLLRQVMQTGQPVLDLEVHGATAPRPNELRDWLVSYYPVRGEDGRIRGVHGVVQDITRRKAAEAALAAAKQAADVAKAAAEDASHAKDRFLAVLSHELRTPLTPVLAGVGMLQADQRFDGDTRELLVMMRRNVELEAQLIDDLLDATRIARGKIELERQRILLGEVLQRTVGICRPDIDARGLSISVDLGNGAPYLLEADEMRLQQVFWNLLRNAIKFTPDGGCIGIRARLDDPHHVVVDVSDSGMGIEAEALDRIFNAFEQGERSVTRQFGGLGLGLAICRSLVEMHGGTIAAQSEGKGKGSTFSIRLPIIAAGQGPNLSQGGGLPSASKPPAAVPRGCRILLVEDHGDTAKLMKRMLEGKGCTVCTAGDVATALDLAGSEPFDLLISDLGLPDGSGIDLMRTLREHGRSIPGLALSGFGQEEDVRRSKEAGFAAHLVKPASLAHLAEAITLALDRPTGNG